MIQNVLSGIGGIGIYGVISVILFFLVFAGALVRVCFIKKPHLDAMSALPLEPDEIAAGTETPILNPGSVSRPGSGSGSRSGSSETPKTERETENETGGTT